MVGVPINMTMASIRQVIGYFACWTLPITYWLDANSALRTQNSELRTQNRT